MFDSYLITHDGYAPEFFIAEFNRAIVACMESGLESFYLSYSMFLSQIRLQVLKYEQGSEEIEEGPVPLQLEQLSSFWIVYGVQITIATVVFVIEIVVHRIRSLRVIQPHDI